MLRRSIVSQKLKQVNKCIARCMDDIPKQYNTAHSAWVWSNRTAKMINAAYVSGKTTYLILNKW